MSASKCGRYWRQLGYNLKNHPSRLRDLSVQWIFITPSCVASTTILVRHSREIPPLTPIVFIWPCTRLIPPWSRKAFAGCYRFWRPVYTRGHGPLTNTAVGSERESVCKVIRDLGSKQTPIRTPTETPRQADRPTDRGASRCLIDCGTFQHDPRY